MRAALAAEPVLAADETPVSVLDRAMTGPGAEDAGRAARAGRPHPRAGLTWLRALGSRQAAAITAVLAFFTGFLITDGYTAYQQLLPQLAGIQQCAAHVIRRCRAVTKLGPGSLQSWAADVIDILREAHQGPSRPGPGATQRSTRNYWPSCASATTRPSPSGSPTTGTATGTRATTPATPSAAGCATTKNRCGCSPAVRRRLDERSGFTLHLLGAFCSAGVFAVVRSCCWSCVEYCVWH